MKNKILFILFTVLIVISCRKDEINDGLINQPPAPLVIYETDLIGSVVDENERAISDVQISSGQNFETTDINGLFKIENLSVDGILGSYISAEADGYFSSGARIYTQGTHARQVEIKLIKKELSGYVNSTKDETVSLDNGLKIDFKANSFTSNGSDYSGLVSVYAYHIDPSQEGYLDLSPGDLSGTDELNNNYILESFGMIAVEMETADGQPVQLKDGFSSTINVPVDASLLGDAPAQLPLWHFDEGLGKWVKEGSAELINGSYVGQVAHFSWWNCDDFLASSDLCLQIFDPRFSGSLGGLMVELNSPSQGSSTTTTDSEGNINGIVPSNEILDVTIFDVCGNNVYTGTIGPYTGTGNKEVINVFLGDVDLYQFSGTIYDCEAMELLANAIVLIEIQDHRYYTETDENGVYTYSAITCNDNVAYAVTAYSLDGESGYATGIANTEVENIIDINLCNASPFLIINGELLANQDIIARRKPNETLIFQDISNSSSLIGFYGFTVGTFPASLLVSLPNIGITSTNCTVTITQFDGLGGMVKGSIQGVDDLNGTNIDGTFVAIIEE